MQEKLCFCRVFLRVFHRVFRVPLLGPGDLRILSPEVKVRSGAAERARVGRFFIS